MRIRRLASFLVLSGMLAGCAAPPAPVETAGGFRREMIEGDRCAANLRQRYLEPVTRPGLQINQSGGVVVAIQRLPKSVVGASLTTTGHEKGYPRILRAWVVALNYSDRDIRFGPSVVSLADGAHGHLQPVSGEAPCEAQATANRQGTPANASLLQDSLIAPHAFAYGILYFLTPPERPLVFPLRLAVRVGDETFEVEFGG
jgi:hypothetical protein